MIKDLSPADLEKYSSQLVKMISGQENLLTGGLVGDSEIKALKLKEISAIYRRDLSDPLNYSLGIAFRQQEKGCSIEHNGALRANASLMKITIPLNLDELKKGEKLDFADDDCKKEI